jgi:hypothetical protein
MIKTLLSSAVAASLFLAVAAPVAFAADAPKTKAACEKVANMKWDATTKTCVKK